MRRFLLTLACVLAAAAPASAGRDTFLGFAKDGSYYAHCSGGFDGMTSDCELCLVDPSAGSASWPKELPKPEAGESCAEACDMEADAPLAKCGEMREKLEKLVAPRDGGAANKFDVSVKRVKDSLVVRASFPGKAPQVLTVDAPDRGSKWLVTGSDALPGGRALAVTLEPDVSGEEMADMVPSTTVVFTPATLARAKARTAAQAQNVAGMAAYRKKDWAAAAKAFRGAVASDPTHVLAHYNLACVAALSNDRATVLEQLSWLKQDGSAAAQERITKARTDPDLASLRDDPEVKKLLGQ